MLLSAYASTVTRLKQRSVWDTMADLAAFITPAAMLSLPSGYSWGSLLWLVCGLAMLVRTWRQRSVTHDTTRPSRATTLRRRAIGWTALSVALLFVVWGMEWWLNPHPTINTVDRPAKYVIALLAWPVIGMLYPRTAVVRWGVWIGALSAAAVAMWQVQVWGWSRAWGHTNAIQFGDLAVLLGVWSWVWAARHGGRWPLIGWLAGWAGFYAAIASQSRGGWIMILPLLLLAWWWTYRQPQEMPSAPSGTPPWQGYAKRVGLAVALVCALLLALPNQAEISSRVRESWTQWNGFWQRNDADTSVGQRLAHWRLAWETGLERPWLGWGDEGYQREKARRVDSGEHPAVLKQFGHAHNDWLDMWARRGLAGIAGLALFFGIQFWVLGQLRRYHRQVWNESASRPAARDAALAGELAACCGQLMVVGYLGFGQTQVMFAHNSGNLSYLFMLVTWLAMAVPPSTTADRR